MSRPIRVPTPPAGLRTLAELSPHRLGDAILDHDPYRFPAERSTSPTIGGISVNTGCRRVLVVDCPDVPAAQVRWEEAQVDPTPGSPSDRRPRLDDSGATGSDWRGFDIVRCWTAGDRERTFRQDSLAPPRLRAVVATGPIGGTSQHFVDQEVSALEGELGESTVFGRIRCLADLHQLIERAKEAHGGIDAVLIQAHTDTAVEVGAPAFLLDDGIITSSELAAITWGVPVVGLYGCRTGEIEGNGSFVPSLLEVDVGAVLCFVGDPGAMDVSSARAAALRQLARGASVLDAFTRSGEVFDTLNRPDDEQLDNGSMVQRPADDRNARENKPDRSVDEGKWAYDLWVGDPTVLEATLAPTQLPVSAAPWDEGDVATDHYCVPAALAEVREAVSNPSVDVIHVYGSQGTGKSTFARMVATGRIRLGARPVTWYLRDPRVVKIDQRDIPTGAGGLLEEVTSELGLQLPSGHRQRRSSLEQIDDLLAPPAGQKGEPSVRLVIIDAWDELNPAARKAVRDLIEELDTYTGPDGVRAPLKLITTGRPDRVPASGPHVAVVELGRRDDKAIGELVDRRLQGLAVPSGTRQRIVELVGGVMIFAELVCSRIRDNPTTIDWERLGRDLLDFYPQDLGQRLAGLEPSRAAGVRRLLTVAVLDSSGISWELLEELATPASAIPLDDRDLASQYFTTEIRNRWQRAQVRPHHSSFAEFLLSEYDPEHTEVEGREHPLLGYDELQCHAAELKEEIGQRLLAKASADGWHQRNERGAYAIRNAVPFLRAAWDEACVVGTLDARRTDALKHDLEFAAADPRWLTAQLLHHGVEQLHHQLELADVTGIGLVNQLRVTVGRAAGDLRDPELRHEHALLRSLQRHADDAQEDLRAWLAENIQRAGVDPWQSWLRPVDRDVYDVVTAESQAGTILVGHADGLTSWCEVDGEWTPTELITDVPVTAVAEADGHLIVAIDARRIDVVRDWSTPQRHHVRGEDGPAAVLKVAVDSERIVLGTLAGIATTNGWRIGRFSFTPYDVGVGWVAAIDLRGDRLLIGGELGLAYGGIDAMGTPDIIECRASRVGAVLDIAALPAAGLDRWVVAGVDGLASFDLADDSPQPVPLWTDVENSWVASARVAEGQLAVAMPAGGVTVVPIEPSAPIPSLSLVALPEIDECSLALPLDSQRLVVASGDRVGIASLDLDQVPRLEQMHARSLLCATEDLSRFLAAFGTDEEKFVSLGRVGGSPFDLVTTRGEGSDGTAPTVVAQLTLTRRNDSGQPIITRFPTWFGNPSGEPQQRSHARTSELAAQLRLPVGVHGIRCRFGRVRLDLAVMTHRDQDLIVVSSARGKHAGESRGGPLFLPDELPGAVVDVVVVGLRTARVVGVFPYDRGLGKSIVALGAAVAAQAKHAVGSTFAEERLPDLSGMRLPAANGR